MEAGTIVVGVVGKTNVGKSTFFAAATETPAKIENRPFVTIDPNIGVGYARKRCVHVELGLPKCDPVNSLCIEGWRFIPVKLLDVAGLVPGAHQGRGLGNRFLDHLRRADALLLVVDASGSTDPEGVPVRPGSYDPVEEARLILREVHEWMHQRLREGWDRFARRVDTSGEDLVSALSQRLSGFEIPRGVVASVLEESRLGEKRLSYWSDDEVKEFVRLVLDKGKPVVIVANKADVPTAERNIARLREAFPGKPVVPASALSELLLRRLSREGIVKYIPGDPSFEVKSEAKLDSNSKKALEYIEAKVMEKWGGTGVVQALNTAVFNALDMIAVYPVEDANRFTDKQGRILPDVVLVKRGSSPRDLAYRIHTDLGKTFLHAINAKTKQRVGESYILQDGDVIKIVAAAGKR